MGVTLAFEGRTQIMGILNITPDSFSDGGQFFDPASVDGKRVDIARVIHHASSMVADGADILDIGGESTRPGADAVDEAQEIDRVMPIVEALAGKVAAKISVDTSKPALMRLAIAAGVEIINDVNALRMDGAVEAVRDSDAYVCLMHMQGEPRTMQDEPHYDDVVGEVCNFLTGRAQACIAAGIDPSRIIIDPGFGFGKTSTHNLVLLRELKSITACGYPVLVGLSRKGMIGKLIGLPPGERQSASVALACLAMINGAQIVRVHDVRETAQAIRMIEAVYPGGIAPDNR